MKTKWKPNKQYPNTYFAKANNYEEYFKLAKDLFDDFDILFQFSVDQFYEKNHLFYNSYESWHVLFNTPCLIDEYYENNDLPNPKEYDGEIKVKPEESEYPVIIMFTSIFDEDMKEIIWQSLNDLE